MLILLCIPIFKKRGFHEPPEIKNDSQHQCFTWHCMDKPLAYQQYFFLQVEVVKNLSAAGKIITVHIYCRSHLKKSEQSFKATDP